MKAQEKNKNTETVKEATVTADPESDVKTAQNTGAGVDVSETDVETWTFNGVLHCDTGPAVRRKDGTCEYWLHGQRVTRSTFEAWQELGDIGRIVAVSFLKTHVHTSYDVDKIMDLCRYVDL